MKIKLFALLTATGLASVICCNAGAGMSVSEHPNVIVILADDQGWGDLSINGNRDISTPNIDKMTRDGARFDRFFVCPVCSPTRAEFLTGRSHVRGGVYSTSAGGERLNPDETTIAEIFKRAGYKTAAFGKWHNGTQYPYHPNARGFDEFYGFCSGHWGNYFDPMLEHNNRIVKGKGYIIDDLTNHAIEFIEKNRTSPFFVYLPYNSPHSPMQVPDRWWNKFKNKKLTMDHRDRKKERIGHTRAALAMCENIDWNVGRLLAKLDELGLAENTIVIYFSDNGPNGRRWNGGMRGHKGSTDEGGVRSPLAIRWTGKIKPNTVIPQICSVMDLLPTLADLCGVKISGTKPLDGISLAPLLFGGTLPERTIVNCWNGKVSVRTQRYRLDNKGHLYDMINDPGQWNDISQEKPEVTASLKKIADDWRRNMLAQHGPKFDNRPFVIGHPGSKYTQLPARDGVAHGNIRRSNKFPNCSFFENWTRLDDKITWTCEVAQSGIYQVDIYYTCPAADVGSTIELAFNNSRLTGKVTEPHDPPLKGAEHDCFPRQESYVKDFKVMTLGNITLKKGKGELTLRALKIPGSKVMDVRMLYLTRIR